MEEVTKLAKELIAIPSVSGGEAEILRFCADWFRRACGKWYGISGAYFVRTCRYGGAGRRIGVVTQSVAGIRAGRAALWIRFGRYENGCGFANDRCKRIH